MADSSGRDYSDLLADVLVSGAPDTELLLRYTHEPEFMDPEDLRVVEEYLAQSPAHRDRLRVLRSIDLLGRVRSAVEAQPRRHEPSTAVLLADTGTATSPRDATLVHREPDSQAPHGRGRRLLRAALYVLLLTATGVLAYLWGAKMAP